MKLIKYILPLLFLFAACSPLILSPTDFSWPVESVLKVNQDGFVMEERHSLSFDTKNLFLKETEDSSAYMEKEIRIIRDMKGFYYITSNGFKNVYIFTANDGELRLDEKILISETGINQPAFNQRAPYVELVDGDQKHLLSIDGIKEEDENEE